MKLVMSIMYSCAYGRIFTPAPLNRENHEARRYDQLLDMMKFASADFDERKYFAYGCNCMFLGRWSLYHIKPIYI